MLLTSIAVIGLAYIVLKPQITAFELSAKADIWQAAILSTPQTTQEDQAYLSSHSLWKLAPPSAGNQKKQAGATKNSETEWKLRGIVKEGQTYFALIEIKISATGKTKLIRLRSGEPLPDQSTITHIDSQKVTIETNGQANQQQLFHTTKKLTP